MLLGFTRDLSPWKGGGFGMFAAIDAPSMRVVECEGTTPDGRVIRIDGFLAVDEDREESSQALPSQKSLRQMGSILLYLELVPVSMRKDAIAARFRAENPDLKLHFVEGSDAGKSFYRPLRSSDPDWNEDEILEIVKVRLRWWRVVFDSETAKLRTEPIGKAVELRRENG